MGEKDRLPFSSWRLTIFTLLCKYFLLYVVILVIYIWLYLSGCLCMGMEARGWRQVSFFDHLHPLFLETGSLSELEVPDSTKTAWSWASRICLCPSPSQPWGCGRASLCNVTASLFCLVLLCFALILSLHTTHCEIASLLKSAGFLWQATRRPLHTVIHAHGYGERTSAERRNQYLRPVYIILWTNLEEGF